MKRVILFSLIYATIIFSAGIEASAAPAGTVNRSSIPFLLAQMDMLGSTYIVNSSLWMLYAFQNPYPDLDIGNTQDSTSGMYTPGLLRQPATQRYVPDHTKSDWRHRYLPDGYYINLDVDSTGSRVTTRDVFMDYDVSHSYDMDLDTYLDIRKKKIQNQLWDSLLTRYDLGAALSGGDIARLISQSTGVTIPIPQNPLMGIFGKPEININVNGEINLRVGWRWDSQNLGTVSAFGQTQSSPIFSQDIRVNVTGSIGDKMKLSTDWNTRTQFDYNNKFKIGYEGEDDEIIKLVEVGNVTLPLQSSLIGGGQALFGVRADFQFGPLFLKTIASQRRGERKFVDVRGGISKQPFSIRAYDYAKNHFFLDTAYRSVYRDYFLTTTPIIPLNATALRVKEIEVWESTGDIREATQYATHGVAYTNLEGKRLKMNEFYDPRLKVATALAGEVALGSFVRLDSMRYDYDRNLGTLTIQSLRPERYYAVAYRVENTSPENFDDIYYGTLAPNPKDTLILKLVYHPNMQPGFKTLWERQMKNIYSINATNVNVNETKIGIWYINQSNDSTDVLPGAPDKLVTVMRVDQVNNSTGAAPPDGQFDLTPPFFNSVTGEITFPSLEPFREGLRSYFTAKNLGQIAEQYVYNEVYDTTYDVARRNTARDRFIISGEVSGRATNRISLGSGYLAPGSVRVSLDGVPLREYDDYVVDYYSGQLTIRNPRASLPNANLKVEYEAQDIFNISTRTLLGLRADYQLFKSRKIDGGLGATLMYYNQSAVIDRVRLGEEPVSNTMLGLDAKLQWETPWLTKMLDYLPFYDTKAQSSIGLRGEWAMIMPEPNKRRSDVISDNNEPVVYIDDFEGAQRYISLGLSPTLWSHSSQPQDESIGATDSARSLYKGKSFWYQYFIPRTPISEVYPERQVVAGRTNLSPLHLVFNPDERGIYNKNPEFLDRKNPNFDSLNIWSQRQENRGKIWGGMMRLLSSFNTNFDNENIEYIEIMMRVDQWEPGSSKMFIDLGQISEDIIPNGDLNTEDGITDANPMPNNIIDAGEDIGIDALADVNERDETRYPFPLNLEPDPSRDNYTFDFGKEDDFRNENDFQFYNNFEGNSTISETGQFPDAEILNRNNGQSIATANDYFTYEVNLEPDPNVNSQIVGGGSNGWFLYRIPIRKPIKQTGNPLFSNIQYVRVWFKGGIVRARIADWRLLGSHWQRISNIQSGVSPNDSVLQVAFVNREENSGPPDYYEMPPGVQAPRQLGSSLQNEDIRLNEQSLSVSVRNLRYGDERMTIRFFRQLDIFNYKILKFFIHGDGSMPDNMVPGAIPKAYAFLRFGIDSMNYYEYRRPLTRGWQNVKIELNQLTAIKQLRDPLRELERQEFTDPTDELASFAIRGNPILTRVQFFGFGIANPAERYPNELTTTMWVDELRLLSPENSSDWAGVSSLDMKLADLGSVNASFANTRPNFHRLEERFGDRINSSNWTVTMQGNIEKFAPKQFKEMKVPITYTHAEQIQDPLYVANNDINLKQASDAAYRNAISRGMPENVARAIADSTLTRSQTVRVQDSWALTGVKLGIPVDNWLIRETVNRITFGYSYAQEFERSPVVAERFNWQWNLTSQYSVNIPDLVSVKPMKFLDDVDMLGVYKDYKINFLPSSFSAGLNMTRRRTTEQSRFLDYPSPVVRDFIVQRQGQMSWKLSENGLLSPIIDYSVNTGSTLVPMELDEFGMQRTGSQLASKVLFYNGGIINFGENNIHSQNVVINFKPKLPIGDRASKFVDMSGSYNVTYNWNNPMQPIPAIHNRAKTAGWNSNFRVTTGFRLKSFADQIFGVQPAISLQKPPKDTSFITTGGILGTITGILKNIFLDYEKIDFNFSQQNSSMNQGVFGGTGVSNFWRSAIGLSNNNMYGPSAAYQMGLVSNPHGSIDVVSSDAFPFFGFSTDHGLRPPNAVMQDNFTQRSTLEMRTSRPLWPGATLDLNWRADLGYNRSQTIETDANGVPTFTNVLATEIYSRNYITLSSFFGINLFNNTIEHVVDLYNERKTEIMARDIDTVTRNLELQNALAESFRTGLEAFSILGGKAGKYFPTVNWTIRWDGIEKWPIFGSVAKRISIEHAYNSRFSETAQITDNGKTIQDQQIMSGFQPLIGITMGFDEKKLDGNLTATIRYSTANGYQLRSSNRSTISRQASDELQIQSSYTLRGFDFPLFGLILKNDLEFSLLTSVKKSRTATFDVMDYSGEAGRTLTGNTQVIVEPRARYSLSSRLSAAFFFRYEGTFNEGAANPGYTTTQVGLDIKLSVAGGR